MTAAGWRIGQRLLIWVDGNIRRRSSMIQNTENKRTRCSEHTRSRRKNVASTVA